MSTAGIMEPDHVKGAKMKKAKEVVDPSLKIAGRPPEPGDPAIPAALTTLRKTASEAGWSVETLYARGITQSPKLVHVYAVRMQRDKQRVTAIWEAPVPTPDFTKGAAGMGSGKLAWKFTYAGMLGLWIQGKSDGSAPIIQPFPFTLNSVEMKGVLKGEPMTRHLIMDTQYDAIEMDDKDERLISEREFRAPFKRAPKKTKEELIADDEMDMVLG